MERRTDNATALCHPTWGHKNSYCYKYTNIYICLDHMWFCFKVKYSITIYHNTPKSFFLLYIKNYQFPKTFIKKMSLNKTMSNKNKIFSTPKEPVVMSTPCVLLRTILTAISKTSIAVLKTLQADKKTYNTKAIILTKQLNISIQILNQMCFLLPSCTSTTIVFWTVTSKTKIY